MLKQFAKRFANGLLNPIGYELRSLASHHDPFVDQRRLVPGARTVFDLGANAGQTAQKYVELFPNATIHSFEPFTDSYTNLVRRHARQPRVHPHNVAIGDADGHANLFLNNYHETNSLFPVAPESRRLVGTELTGTKGATQIPMVTLDSFCSGEAIAHIDVLKMDIQGAELLALKGAAGLLRGSAISVIYTEVLFAELYRGQAFMTDLWSHLRQYDYSLYGIYNLCHGVSADSLTELAWGDALFVSADVRAKIVTGTDRS